MKFYIRGYCTFTACSAEFKVQHILHSPGKIKSPQMAPRLAQSPRKNVESTVDFPNQNMKKMANPLGDGAAFFWPFQQPPIFFLGSKKSLGHFPDLNWFGVSSQCSSHSKLWCIHFNEEQKLSTVWGISFLVGRKNRSNHPMSTSTLTSRLLFSKKKVGSKPTKSLHKRPFHQKKLRNSNIYIHIYISATVNGNPPQARWGIQMASICKQQRV